MTKLDHQRRPISARAQWAWLLPILALAPFSLAAKGCTNSGVVGDDCPTDRDCMTGSAGSSGTAGGSGTAGDSGTAGTGNGNGGGTCGWLLGTQCAKGQFCDFAPEAKCGAADQTGTCQPLPQACDLIYAPVCGCDGMTYGNDCAANAAGVSVASQGECGGPGPGDGTCGGLLGRGCAKGEFCNFPPDAMCGAADQTGKCAPTGGGCTKEYAPVCGCDDMTYGNACMAASAGVSVQYSGECKTAGCGGRGGASCDTDQFCQYEPKDDCGRFDAPGTCVDLPSDGACDANYAPVCGCDGMTYGNDCEALNAGVSVDHEGECNAACGGLAGLECPADQFCDYPLETACGNADFMGECKTKPEACTQEYAPVCGCDGMTYGNDCAAAAAGVSVQSTGACK